MEMCDVQKDKTVLEKLLQEATDYQSRIAGSIEDLKNFKEKMSNTIPEKGVPCIVSERVYSSDFVGEFERLNRNYLDLSVKLSSIVSKLFALY